MPAHCVSFVDKVDMEARNSPAIDGGSWIDVLCLFAAVVQSPASDQRFYGVGFHCRGYGGDGSILHDAGCVRWMVNASALMTDSLAAVMKTMGNVGTAVW